MGAESIIGSPTQPDKEQLVILLHSLGTDNGMWQGVSPYLEGRFTLVTPDSRGHGRNNDPGQIDLAAWVDDVTAIVDSHPDADVHVVGLSMGGVQALASAVALGTRLKSLTVANSFAALPTVLAAQKIDDMRAQIEELGMTDFAAAYLEGTLVAPVDEGVYRSLSESIAGVDAGRYMESAEATFHVDLIGELAGIAVPTLVITSELDHKTPSSLSQTISDGIPGARIISIAGAGHLSSVEKPADFAAALESFWANTQSQEN